MLRDIGRPLKLMTPQKSKMSARDGKASKKDLDKLREANKDIREFENAEDDKNNLAQKIHVKKHRDATDAKKSMETINEEVIAYHKAKNTRLILKTQERPENLSFKLQAAQQGAREIHPILAMEVIEERQEREERHQLEEALMPAATPAGDSSKKTSKDRPRHKSRDRSNPPTGSKPPASASKEPKTNSGKHRRASPHTNKERHLEEDGDDDIIEFEEMAIREKAKERERAGERERARQMERAKR
ncbi:hypothetical protein BHYA_0106g00410 [Botrytis hyacinthi]|uniref:Uncharacterized protein n=1 Tax=Botrytis hyacinthi TaxID=278943 RepID=A0A4Z1GLE8_9HELO|nr:hypothetical protein BHYA_0106g00410 [Botrytis hyacinthi]